MISTYCHAYNMTPMLLDACEKPLGEVIEDIRRLWNEEAEGSQMFWLMDEAGNILATMLRDQSDPEIAITLYADGTVERHRCHYVLDADGYYMGTEITDAA